MLSIKVMHGNCHFNKGLLSLTFGLKCFCYLLGRFKICQQISMKHQNMNIGYLADNMCHFLCKMHYIRQMQIDKVNYLCSIIPIVRVHRLPKQCTLFKGSVCDHLADNMSNSGLVFCKNHAIY